MNLFIFFINFLSPHADSIYDYDDKYADIFIKNLLNLCQVYNKAHFLEPESHSRHVQELRWGIRINSHLL